MKQFRHNTGYDITFYLNSSNCFLVSAGFFIVLIIFCLILAFRTFSDEDTVFGGCCIFRPFIEVAAKPSFGEPSLVGKPKHVCLKVFFFVVVTGHKDAD